jgi:hypothetical protein
MQPLVSREYKLMLDSRLFGDRRRAADELWAELQALADRLDIQATDEFSRTKQRWITFLDTADHAILANGLVFRQRLDAEKEACEYTLKCRSPDRYVAAGTDVTPAGQDSEVKLEEDIAAPFVSRFSHSGGCSGPGQPPATIREAAQLFSALGHLRRDGRACAADLPLGPVNSLRIFERVLQGPEFRFGELKADVAVILWSDGERGRTLVAEFSIRCEHSEEGYTLAQASSASRLFAELQHVDWFLPAARSKTQFAYRAP